ncbi:MAG: hypothetical protein JJE25_07745 [Bacteroidia bacterium]|nr:hypothetical protein [Bacteroidia bacterium]
MNAIIRNISSAAVIFSLLFFYSCLKNNSAELKQTDSLITMLDSSEKIFLSFDTNLVKNILDSSDRKVELLRKFAPDSLDKEITILLSDYLHINKTLEKSFGERNNVNPQITFSRKQLDDMKRDLNNGAMSKEDFTKNFPEEEKAVSELSSYIVMINTKTNLLLAQYEFIRTKVDSFITTLDTTHESEKKNRDLNLGNIDMD